MSDININVQGGFSTPPQMSNEKKLEMLKQALEGTDDPNLIKKIKAEMAYLVKSIHLND